MLRNCLLATASLGLFTFLSAPSIAQTHSPAACGTGPKITVNLLFPTQPASLDANYDTNDKFLQITRNLYDALFWRDDDMQIQPGLATGYQQPDSKTYDIALRDDVNFHDGTPFTAADVVSTFNRIVGDEELKSKQRFYTSNIESVTELDSHKVRFTLKAPDATFISVLASILFITPKAAVEAAGNVEYGKHPVGSGPFRFKAWNEGDSVVLEANCDYWGVKPIPSEVEFRFIAEPATQISSLQSGEIDIATQVLPDLAESIANSTAVSVKSITGNRTVTLQLNTLSGPLSDLRVRQALNYSVDRDSIAGGLFHGRITPVGQSYGPNVFGYSTSVGPYPYDPEKAKALLAEAGFDASNPLSIELVNPFPELNSLQQSLASYFSGVGINVTTKYDPNFFADFWVAKKMGENQLFFFENNNLLMDADFALGLTLDGARRGIYFHTAESDAAIADARGITDVAARQEAYDKVNAMHHDLAPVVYLYTNDAIYGVSNSIDWKPRPDAAIYLAGVTKTQ